MFYQQRILAAFPELVGSHQLTVSELPPPPIPVLYANTYLTPGGQ